LFEIADDLQATRLKELDDLNASQVEGVDADLIIQQQALDMEGDRAYEI
jgi:hypothetical protein